MRNYQYKLNDNPFFASTLAIILMFFSVQSKALPDGFSWSQVFKLDTQAKRLIDIMYCDHPSCSKQIGSGPKDTLNFSARGQGNFNSLATWNLENLTGLSVQKSQLQLCEKNPGDIPYYSSFQAKGTSFAYYQTSDSYDKTDGFKLMSGANYTYSKPLRPRPWKGNNSALLVRFKVAMPVIDYDQDNVISAARVIIKIGYNNSNHSAHNRYFWVKPQFFASDPSSATDNVRVDPNTSTLMVRSFIKRDTQFMKVSGASSLIQSSAFLDDKTFEIVLEKKHLKRIIEAVNSHPKYSGKKLPTGNSHWQFYEVKGFSLNQETNLDHKGLGYAHDFEAALRSTLFEVYTGAIEY